jgi:hypothetical protein
MVPVMRGCGMELMVVVFVKVNKSKSWEAARDRGTHVAQDSSCVQQVRPFGHDEDFGLYENYVDR